jgi:hypothetical protein
MALEFDGLLEMTINKRKGTMATKTKLKPVIVRTYSAGVHFGYLKARRGKEVDLVRSRRIWSWKGANTLSEIATSGLNEKESRVACEVSITLTEAIEVIDCTKEAVASLSRVVWANQK